MKSLPCRLPLLLASALLLGGCASIDTEAPRGGGLAGVSRFFVVSNLNDNHALDQRIAAALQARGLTVTAGPLTMMPDDAQVIVTYQDHWNWDFGEHIDYLRLVVRKPEATDDLAGATYSSRIPGKEGVAETVGRVVGHLFDNKSTPVRPADAAPATPDQAAGRRKRGG